MLDYENIKIRIDNDVNLDENQKDFAKKYFDYLEMEEKYNDAIKRYKPNSSKLKNIQVEYALKTRTKDTASKKFKGDIKELKTYLVHKYHGL